MSLTLPNLVVVIYTTCRDVLCVNENIVYRYIGTVNYQLGRTCIMYRSVSSKIIVKTTEVNTPLMRHMYCEHNSALWCSRKGLGFYACEHA